MIATAPRVGRLVPTAVNSILADVRQVQATGKSVVSLMRGEPDFRTPAHIAEAAVAALRAGRTGYPDNRGELTLPRGGGGQAGARQRRHATTRPPRSWSPPAPRSASTAR